MSHDSIDPRSQEQIKFHHFWLKHTFQEDVQETSLTGVELQIATRSRNGLCETALAWLAAGANYELFAT